MNDINVTIGSSEYSFRQANFMDARKQAFKLATLLRSCFKTVKDENGNNVNDFDVGQLVANLNSTEVEEVTKFICLNATVTDADGKKYLLQKDSEANEFFNSHRDEYFQFLFEGLKFHFLGFLPSGIASKINTLSLDSLADLAM